MTVDTLVAFAALEQHGIHIARSAYVDSEGAAVAFAERRDAPDPRFVPITLRSTAAPQSARHEPLHSVDTVRAAYARLNNEKTKAGERILAQVVIEHGTMLEIRATTDATIGKILSLGTELHGVGRAVPLSAESATALAQSYRAYGHRGSSEKMRRMLEHLLMRVSAFFAETDVTEFRLAVCLHDETYSVMDAAMESSRPLHVKKRLAHRAHDRKGDEYHAAGQQ